MELGGPPDAVLEVRCAILDVLLASTSPDAVPGHREIGRELGAMLADRIRTSAASTAPSWDGIRAAWSQLELGDLWPDQLGPGLLRITLANAGIPASSVVFVEGLFEGFLGAVAGEPVGAVTPVADRRPSGVDVVLLVGQPELIARLRPGLESGRTVAELMEEAWT